MATRPDRTPAPKTKPWTRAGRMLAMLPPKSNISDHSDTSSDEEDHVFKNRRSLESPVTSEAPSIDSELEGINISDDEVINIPAFSDEDEIPPTPIMNEMLSATSQIEELPAILSVSSILSPKTPNPNAATPKVTRALKRKQCFAPTFVAKKKKKYVAKPLTFQWSVGQFKHRAMMEDFSFSEIEEIESPLDYFRKFFSDDIIKLIVEQTNLYSVQKTLVKCVNVTDEEIKDFLAMNILMGVVQMPAYRDYWNKELRYAPIADVMSLKRYEQIRQYLHFADNSQDDNDRYYKIRPVMEKVRLNCLKIEEEKIYSVDEMMIPYKGTRAGSRRQYVAKKPKKWGFKMFVRSGVSGLVYDYLPYGGEDTFRNHTFTEYEESLGLGAKVVLALCQSIHEKPAVVTFDNFFTSLELVRFLRSEHGIFSLGTIRSNRLRGCQDKLPSDKILAKQGRGASKQFVCNQNQLAVVKWYDNKAVNLASSFVDSYPIDTVKRFSKVAKKKVDVPCPKIVKTYNSNMGGVDLSDMLVSLYRTEYKTKRWYMALFSQILDICVNNAWLLYRRDFGNCKQKPRGSKCMKLKQFRLQIYAELLRKNRSIAVEKTANEKPTTKIKTPVAPRPTDAVRLDKVGHLPSFVDKGRCKNCKRGFTNVWCSKCQLRLCFVLKRNCFLNYHTAL